MDTSAKPPGMILLLRVWMDGDRADEIRARLTSSIDNMNTEQPVGASSGVDQIVGDVRDRLERFHRDMALAETHKG
jgi:hypothetical protein